MRAETPHHARSVNFNSPGTYSKRVSYHLVRVARQYASEYITPPWRQRGEARPGVFGLHHGVRRSVCAAAHPWFLPYNRQLELERTISMASSSRVASTGLETRPY